MRIRCIIFFLLLAAGGQLHAQYYFYNGDYYESDFVYELGGSVGAINALTDLGGKKGPGKSGVKDYNIKNTDLCGSLFFGVMYKNMIAVRLEGTFGKVRGYDSILKPWAPSTDGRYERNLSFTSPITEVVALAEFHPFEIFGNYSDSRYPPEISPYLVAGVGYFRFNPQTELNGQLIDLKPLHTEGQGFDEYPNVKDYKLNQINFPFGFGARYEVSPILNVRLEFLYRYLATDYLDDVSGRYIEPSVFAKYLTGNDLTHAILLNDRHIPGAKHSTAHPDGIRGNPSNDAYFTVSLKFGLTLGRERR